MLSATFLVKLAFVCYEDVPVTSLVHTIIHVSLYDIEIIFICNLELEYLLLINGIL